jgi:hypothetical protein
MLDFFLELIHDARNDEHKTFPLKSASKKFLLAVSSFIFLHAISYSYKKTKS